MIRKVFYKDFKNLFKSFFAIVIVIGICVIPALYAWLNIYSNYDPYANTGAIKMAVVSLDKGYNNEGEELNVGDTIIENLHNNNSINWQFVKTKQDAVSAVESGEYYAALIIPENFTASMYNIFSDEVKRPSLILYQNQKKNAVANKITDTVTTTLQSNLNETFVGILTTKVFNGLGDINDKMSDDTAKAIVDKLTLLKQDVGDFKTTLSNLNKGSAVLRSALNAASSDATNMAADSYKMSTDISNTKNEITSAANALDSYSTLVTTTIDNSKRTLKELKSEIESAKVSKDINSITASTKQANKDLATLKKDIKALKEAVSEDVAGVDTSKITSACDSMSTGLSKVDKSLAYLEKLDGASESAANVRADVVKNIDTALTALDTLETILNDSLVPAVKSAISSISAVLDSSSLTAGNLGKALESSIKVFDAFNNTLDQTENSLDSTSEFLDLFENRLDMILDKVNGASDNELQKVLVDTLSGDVDMYAEFFSEPVKIETNSIYPSSNYGSSVAPFYTVLALWVGALMLAAIIKVHPTADFFPGAKDRELYFGRLISYIILGQIQSLIIVWGDLVLLKIDCKEVALFVVASSFISLTFAVFIFSLVYTFGDVGKAIAVVVVVLQIAGSSGTYPIELLPDFFKNVYIFFPFPYAINATRECVGGRYADDYFIYLIKLSMFIIVGLVIGVFIRKPFLNMNHYVEKRMEDTEMM
ncbi:MAG: YhgE/Pip domain-containing protein [Lachnospiraceae bacterium]|nr:YhgE/Pip domain-containing protein [Lachnospiraceae bacterium]